jgi:hypothetical protein
MNPLESELVHPETPKAKFDLTATLRSLSTILIDTELGAVSPLVASEKREPEGLFRHEGSLYVRYFTTHWYIEAGTLDRFSGMPPYVGVEKLEIPR